VLKEDVEDWDLKELKKSSKIISKGFLGDDHDMCLKRMLKTRTSKSFF
jgi:hypothetical protein